MKNLILLITLLCFNIQAAQSTSLLFKLQDKFFNYKVVNDDTIEPEPEPEPTNPSLIINSISTGTSKEELQDQILTQGSSVTILSRDYNKINFTLIDDGAFSVYITSLSTNKQLIVTADSGKTYDKLGNLIINGSYMTNPLTIGWNKIENLPKGTYTFYLNTATNSPMTITELKAEPIILKQKSFVLNNFNAVRDNGFVSGNMLINNSTADINGIEIRNYDNPYELINITTNKKGRIKLFIIGGGVRLILNSGKSLMDEYGNIMYTNGLQLNVPSSLNNWIEFPVDLPAGNHTISLIPVCSSSANCDAHSKIIKEIDLGSPENLESKDFILNSFNAVRANGFVSGNMLINNSTADINGIEIRNYDNPYELINITTNKKGRIKLFIIGGGVRLILNSGKSLMDEYGNIMYTNGLQLNVPSSLNNWIEFPVDLPAGNHTISLIQVCSSSANCEAHSKIIKEIDLG